MRKIVASPSPNHNQRAAGKAIDILLLHYTGMRDGDAALRRLRNPAAKVSSHYLIGEDGRIHRLVDESRRAWHAGVSFWAGERDINGISIGSGNYSEKGVAITTALDKVIVNMTGSLKPAQLISYGVGGQAVFGLAALSYGGPYDLATQQDHYNHVHVGFS